MLNLVQMVLWFLQLKFHPPPKQINLLISKSLDKINVLLKQITILVTDVKKGYHKSYICTKNNNNNNNNNKTTKQNTHKKKKSKKANILLVMKPEGGLRPDFRPEAEGVATGGEGVGLVMDGNAGPGLWSSSA
jgi:hypothetical protein